MRPVCYLSLIAAVAGCESGPQVTQPPEASVNQATLQYTITKLPNSLGGTVNRGTAINNQGLVAGFSNLAGNLTRHARTATGVNQLPFGAAVQLDVILRLG